MASLPSVCVLLAAYNGEKFILEQIESILAQVGVDVTLVISIDKSTDATEAICKKLQEENNKIVLLPTSQRFGSAGRNFFRLLYEVDFSIFEYVSLADQDDVWFDFKLKHAIQTIRQNDSAGYSSNVMAFWDTGKEKLVKKNHTQTEFDYLFESAGPGCTFVMTSVLGNEIKKLVTQKYDLIDRVWLHDWFCYAFARLHNHKWIIDGKPTMMYRQHTSNEVGVNFGLRSLLIRARSILSGDGLDKVLNQAEFLDIQDAEPIKLLRGGGRLSLFFLALKANRCRRKALDKVMFFCAFLLFSLSGRK